MLGIGPALATTLNLHFDPGPLRALGSKDLAIPLQPNEDRTILYTLYVPPDTPGDTHADGHGPLERRGLEMDDDPNPRRRRLQGQLRFTGNPVCPTGRKGLLQGQCNQHWQRPTPLHDRPENFPARSPAPAPTRVRS